MSADEEDVDTSRKTVKTFVPAYQKAEWKRHADDLDMSQSEFVRTMVQAGRRDFEIEGAASSGSGPESTSESAPEANSRGDEHPGGDASDATDAASGADLEEHVVRALSGSEHLSWDELVERLTSDIEDRLDETLQELQADNRVQYSGRHGGYALTGGDDGV